MEKEVKPIEVFKVDPLKLHTQQAYAKKTNLTRGRICQLVKANKLPIVKINGAKLIYY